jgi:vitamin B12 transporter
MNKKMFQFCAIFALMTTCAFAQQIDTIVSNNQLEEVVVSDSKFALSKEKSGKVITKITAEDLKNQSGQSIATILGTVAGVEINGNQSGAGKNLGLFIRGGKSNQVLVLIDGIPVIDASGINLEYDLRLLTADQVESIEIMKGAASTLYGSGAATGLINIKLKKANQKKMEANYNLNIGTNNTAFTQKTSGQDVNQGFALKGATSKINYFAAINRTETWGMSQIAAPIETINYEEDKFSRQNYLAKFGVKVNAKLTLDFFGNFDKIKNDYDGTFDNTGSSDLNENKSVSEQFRFGFSPKYKYQKGEFVLNTSFNKITRSYNDFSTWSGTTDFYQYDSRSANVDGFNKYIIDEKLFLVLGTQYQFHDMKYNTPYSKIEKESAKFNMVDPYFTVVYNSDFGLNLNAGARLNVHSQYGNEAVYNINPSLEIKDLNLKFISSISTAFITPSLYQLYSEYGNLDLKPEKNLTIETGFETKLFHKKLILNTVGFYREQKNFIGFYYNPITFAGNYINIDGSYHAKGIETELSFNANNWIKINSNYTFTAVEEALDRLIPKHKINGNIDFQLKKTLYFGLNYQYLNGRNDAFFDGNTYKTVITGLGSYQLLNSTLRYDLIQNRLTIFANVTNILNADFVENVGYSARGRNFRLGLNVKL